MAKIKKQTNKRSTSNVKASTGKGLKKKFNLQSKKVQFFVVIVIVALLGGGWFTYKSFALTDVIQARVIDYNKGLASDIEKKSGSNKNGAWVARISPGQEAKWVVNQYSGKKDLLPNFNSGGRYRFCVFVRYENPSISSKAPTMRLQVFQRQGIIREATESTAQRKANVDHIVNSPTTYAKKCTYAFNGWGRDSIDLRIKNNGPSTIRAGSFTIERL